MPPKSKWPASIKVGTPFDLWAVIDNHVPNTGVSMNYTNYAQKAWPSRYDYRIGGLQFSSNGVSPSTFGVSIQDELPGNGDAYVIYAMYGSPVPEAPDLEPATFKISLFPKDHTVITTAALPLRPIPVNVLTGGFLPHFRAIATAKSDHSDQTLSGKADKFEVFQASADTPLRLSGR